MSTRQTERTMVSIDGVEDRLVLESSLVHERSVQTIMSTPATARRVS